LKVFYFSGCYYNININKKTEDVHDYSECLGAGGDLMEGDIKDASDMDDTESEKPPWSEDFGEGRDLGSKETGPDSEVGDIGGILSKFTEANTEPLSKCKCKDSSFGIAVISHGHVVELDEPSAPGKTMQLGNIMLKSMMYLPLQ